ncbi:DUF2797 domain-containing protein [Halocola ammonii]
MEKTGNIRKMRTSLEDEVQYRLPLYDVLEEDEVVEMNELIGKEISLRFQGQINCVVTGKKIKKTFGEGMSWEAFKTAPQAAESIIHPELSRIHEGIALRDKEWEEKHHNQPHVVYLSLTGGVKVGVTRETNIPYRWIDQGAVEALLLAEVPYRQLAGLIEVEMKQHIADKTNWRQMLTNKFTNEMSLTETKEHLLDFMPEEYHDFVVMEDEITEIKYPVLEYPKKVKSVKLDKVPVIEQRLIGIKGQYLIFGDNTVINMRSHAGYKVTVEV